MAGFAALGRFVRTLTASALAAVTALVAAPAFAQPAVWTVKDADSTLYILGTVHLLRPETQWHSDKLDAAIAASTELWLELPTTDPERLGPEMIRLVRMYGVGKSRLSAALTSDELATLDEAARLSGVTASQLEGFRPWYAALVLSQAAMERAGFDDASGVDRKIEAAFRARKIEPKGLETAEEQIKVFASMTPDQELRYLRETMEEYHNASTELDRMVSQWAAADIAGLEELFVSELKTTEPDLYAALLTNRNANWIGKIEGILAGKGVSFMAVGAGHLVGPDSVIAMLAAKGIKAERLQ